MNPDDLSEPDIDYELGIRDEMTIGSIDTKKRILRRRLQEEVTGAKLKPLYSNQEAVHDVEACTVTVKELETHYNKPILKLSKFQKQVVLSKLHHIRDRLIRIKCEDDLLLHRVRAMMCATNDMIVKVAGEISPRLRKTLSFSSDEDELNTTTIVGQNNELPSQRPRVHDISSIQQTGNEIQESLTGTIPAVSFQTSDPNLPPQVTNRVQTANGQQQYTTGAIPKNLPRVEQSTGTHWTQPEFSLSDNENRIQYKSKFARRTAGPFLGDMKQWLEDLDELMPRPENTKDNLSKAQPVTNTVLSKTSRQR
jgi:hypothetical protein